MGRTGFAQSSYIEKREKFNRKIAERKGAEVHEGEKMKVLFNNIVAHPKVLFSFITEHRTQIQV